MEVINLSYKRIDRDGSAAATVQPAESPADVSARLNAIRRRFLISVCTVMFALAVIGLPISLARIPAVGFNLNHAAHIVVSVLIGLMFVFRNRLTARRLSRITLILSTVMSLAAFWQYGIVSAGFFLSAMSIFLAGATLGLRGGIVCAAFHFIMISIFAFLWLTGRLVFPIDVHDYVLQPSVWALLTISFIITTAIYFLSATSSITELKELAAAVESPKKELEVRADELYRKNQALQTALGEVKILSGLLPICARCKKIRNDSGYWQQVEQYVEEHSRAEFTHSICPDCLREMYPHLADRFDDEDD